MFLIKKIMIIYLFLYFFRLFALEQEPPKAIPVLSLEDAEKANKEAVSFFDDMVTNKSAITALNNKRLLPEAIPVLTPEEALRANDEAIKDYQNKLMAKSTKTSIPKVDINFNRILLFLPSLLPLLLIIDLILFKRKKKHSSRITDYISLPRRIRILFSVSLLAFGTLVFVPWSIYFGNSIQFPFIFQDFVSWNLCVLTISIIGASIILLLIPPIISDYLIAVIAGLGLCVYVQAMFMNLNLGTMASDGAEPPWEDHRVFGMINLIIWIAIISVPVVLKKVMPSIFSNAISATTGIVLLLEILASASMVISANQNVWTRVDTFYVDGSKQFQLSKDKNVIVFIFDNLSTEFINLCFAKHPETREIVKDFIWYDDARSNYRQTFPGLHHELTGTLVHIPAKNLDDLFEKSWHSPSAKSFFD